MMQIDDQSEPLPPSLPAIDFAGIQFPSDKITLAHIRRVHPKEFDTPGRNFFDGPKMGRPADDWPQEPLSEMLSIERLIAKMVFDSVCQGKPQASILNSRWEDDVELIETLSGYYARYGVAQGPQQSRRLIASIEEQAAKQVGHVVGTKRDMAR